MQMEQTGKLILIGGGSSSGKTTLSFAVPTLFPAKTVSCIALDNYYKDLSDYPQDQLTDYNFDHPDAIDRDKLQSDLNLLLTGNQLPKISYCFVSHSRLMCDSFIEPTPIIIVEGIFALCLEELTKMATLSVFIDADSDTRLIRRLKRDQAERGRTFDSIVNQYIKSVKPMYQKYINPTKCNADLVLSGNDNDYDNSLELLKDSITRILNE